MTKYEAKHQTFSEGCIKMQAVASLRNSAASILRNSSKQVRLFAGTQTANLPTRMYTQRPCPPTVYDRISWRSHNQRPFTETTRKRLSSGAPGPESIFEVDQNNFVQVKTKPRSWCSNCSSMDLPKKFLVPPKGHGSGTVS